MTDFKTLLSSIGGQSQQTRAKPSLPLQTSNRSQPTSDDAKSSSAIVGVKRKSEEPLSASKPKIARTSFESSVVRNAGPSASGASSSSASATTNVKSVPYKGTARVGTISKSPIKPTPKVVTKPNVPQNVLTDTNNAPKPGARRGFASIMEKAKAAQEVAKAIGNSGIKHKPVERLTKRDRQRQAEEAKQKSSKSDQVAGARRVGGALPGGTTNAVKKKTQETSYKGTMKKATTQLSYKGTMRALGPGVERPKPPAKKGLGQDKYGGYASWSDLDEAEDEEEEEEEEDGYNSEGSSDMEAGWGDTEREEINALKFAKREDQEALEEEERLKREKLERKRRLEELSKSNAAKRKY